MKINSQLIIIGTSLLIAGIIFNIASGINSPKTQINTNESKLRTELKEEFKGAYRKTIKKSGELKKVNLIASESEVEIFDGHKTKVWSYNQQIPGPKIRLKLGDTIEVNFTNNLPDETTIHWHGVRVPNAMDGVPGVTQEPIQPGESFIYKFTPKDAGTFWFHPHVRGSEQVERGLYGTLIVEDEASDQYSQDITWIVDDWRLMENYQINPNFNTMHDLAHDGRWGNVITVNGKLTESLIVKPGERIRLRMINTSNGRVYAPYFGGLDAKIIAVDGLYTKKPLSADEFELAPGNRIDVDIKIPINSDKKEYEINDYFTRNTNLLGKIIVQGEVISTPDFEYPNNPLIPDWSQGSQISSDKIYRLNARRASGSGMGMMGGIEWTINDKAFPDYDPFEFKHNEFNKITFVNESYRLHPMHLHGQFFKVLSRNGQLVDEPYFRDTVLIDSKETVELGLVPMDKGQWVQHCHILEHAEAGMLTITTVK